MGSVSGEVGSRRHDVHPRPVVLDLGPGVDGQLLAVDQQQAAALRAGVFQRQAHQGLLQLRQHDLSGDGFGGFHHGQQVQLLGPRGEDCHRGQRRCLDQLRMLLIELPHLAVGSPAGVTVPGFTQVVCGDPVEVPRSVEPGGELQRPAPPVDEAVLRSGADGLVVQVHGIEIPALDPGQLRADEVITVGEVLRAVIGPEPMPLQEIAQSLPEFLLPLTRDLRVERRERQGVVEVVRRLDRHA